MSENPQVPELSLADLGIHDGMTDGEIQRVLRDRQEKHEQRVVLALVNLGHDRQLTREDVATAMVQVGRIPAGGLVADLFYEQLLSTEVAAFAVPEAWSMAEFPGQQLEPDTWRDLFDHAGYTVDGEPAPRPAGRLRLYRGSTPEHHDGWSWTDQLDVARRYASGTWYRRRTGTVWTAAVAPGRLLARITDRDEHEYVVDTAGLTIREYK